ncbi:hypothetical protein QF205_06895 [Luteimonas composti]|uniref:Uncharacterized protein n=1 Tax=Luteimonas composti TaxID=398257 RepID=A0ABT6MQS1_9GAMM|nr:hypothetical protein [Luteimonas composti]MDH7452808.1 hypothetical protein [Luteimonas composti]
MGVALFRVWCRACLGLAVFAAPALQAAPDPAMAGFVFQEARSLCERDAGALWGQSLCGPIMIVDPADRRVIANQADPGGVLQAGDGVWTGELPAGTMMANTRLEWSGTAWTQLVWPLPMEPALLRVFLGHEMFHRVQPGLGLARGEAGNRHLDGFDGRYLLQLEWRALARALLADTAAARRDHVADALAFRQARRRVSADAAADESALEINEGLPEYSGVRTGLVHAEQRRAYAVYALARFLDAPSFVRSFAYASGPAYGLLLDDADPGWRGRLGTDADLGALLASALRIDPDDGADLAARGRRYDPDGTLRDAEQARERERSARQETWRKQLVEGPVLVLPLSRPSFQFNPQTLAALDDVGTVYPTLRLGDAWGELVVDGGVALVHADRKRATVALPADRSALSGDGWTLALKPGWKLARGERCGDMTVVRESESGD